MREVEVYVYENRCMLYDSWILAFEGLGIIKVESLCLTAALRNDGYSCLAFSLGF